MKLLRKKKEVKFADVKAPEQSKEEMEQELEELEAEEQVKPLEVPKPIKKEEKEEPKEEVKNVAMIVSSRFNDNGNIETVIISNKALGEVGESWNLDEEE